GRGAAAGPYRAGHGQEPVGQAAERDRVRRGTRGGGGRRQRAGLGGARTQPSGGTRRGAAAAAAPPQPSGLVGHLVRLELVRRRGPQAQGADHRGDRDGRGRGGRERGHRRHAEGEKQPQVEREQLVPGGDHHAVVQGGGQ